MLKKFESVNTKQEIRITLTSNYALGFPNKFYTENTISSYKYVVLFYDEESKEIGIHFSNDDDEKHKFKIRHDKNGRGGSVTIKSLLKTLNYSPNEYKGRYTWEKRNEESIGDLYIITLEKRDTKPELQADKN